MADNISSSHQRGSASIEYVIGTTAVIASLFLPMPGFDASLITVFLDALKAFQDNTTYLMSLP